MRIHLYLTLWFLMSVMGLSSPGGEMARAEFRWESDDTNQHYTLWDGQLPVLRYNFGTVPMPPGREPLRFSDGRPYGGARSDYIHPLYGTDGEILTEDYPEHPHHRGIWWSWPVVRWNDRVADIWAVCDVWARPEKLESLKANPHIAELVAVNRWEFGTEEKHPIVRERVVIRIWPKTSGGIAGRWVEIDVALTALEPKVSIGGRPQAGYGGMAFRAMPGTNQQITPVVDDASVKPRRAWCQYSAEFAGAPGPTLIVLFQHPGNPAYPSVHNVYPELNCFMPAFPGDNECPLPQGQPVLLRHGLWVRKGEASQDELQAMWDAYSAGRGATRRGSLSLLGNVALCATGSASVRGRLTEPRQAREHALLHWQSQWHTTRPRHFL